MKVTLGKTGITADKNGFGALPIQRIGKADAVRLLHRAHSGGMTFFDTARAYSDSEEKLGAAFADRRSSITIATKTHAKTGGDLHANLAESLRQLRTDYIDLYQLHNPPFCPRPEDGSGLYEALLEAKQQGKIRFIGITSHLLTVAREAIASGLYDTLQFPLSYLASEEDLELVELCRQANMGFIAMKGLCGGLLTNSAAAYAYLAQFPQVLPIWGIQRDEELDEFLSYVTAPPAMTPQLEALIKKDRQELQGNFCRGCGYCLPCPANIEINNAARMIQLLRRAPTQVFLSEVEQEKMHRVKDCLHCGSCASKCPYGLDTPKLLEENYRDYLEVLAGKPV